MVTKSRFDLQAMVKDIGLEDKKAVEAAIKYCAKQIETSGDCLTECDVNFILTSFYDGYCDHAGIAYQ